MSHLALEGLVFSHELQFMVRRLAELKLAVEQNTPMNLAEERDRLCRYWAICRQGFDEKLAVLVAAVDEEGEVGCE